MDPTIRILKLLSGSLPLALEGKRLPIHTLGLGFELRHLDELIVLKFNSLSDLKKLSFANLNTSNSYRFALQSSSS